jgi:GH25 family lysozyme M1 (1,4-beta-N-acetylmuramidase)
MNTNLRRRITTATPGRRTQPARALGDTTRAGATEHFEVYYENSLGDNGLAIAQAVLQTCEGDYQSLKSTFSGSEPADLPFRVVVANLSGGVGTGGASHPSCLSAQIEADCQTSPTVNPNRTRFLIAAEVVEVFAAKMGDRWDCGHSHGEGLSRVLATDLYPAEVAPYTTANMWLNGHRDDFVANTTNTDVDPNANGCAVLFLNYLRFQLGLSWQNIVKNGAPTLAGTYTNLTGRTDAFDRFSVLLQSHFPAGTPTHLDSDNPFPLPESGLKFSIASAEGIDVSAVQGDIDWSAVKGDGIQFAYIKATEGATFNDKKFIANWASAAAQGIKRGAYHFFQPGTDVAAQSQNFINALGTLGSDDLPPVLDIETNGQNWDLLPQAQRIPAVLKWLNAVKAQFGQTPVIYTNRASVSAIFGDDPGDLAQFPLGVASWTSASSPSLPAGWNSWAMWQYTDSGTVAGIAGNVDRDRAPAPMALARTQPVESKSSLGDGSGLMRAICAEVKALPDKDRLFPNGIDSIEIAVQAGLKDPAFSFTIKLAGPPNPK